MSSTSYNFRRRIGRAASPPTWACYEQINDYYPQDDDDQSDESDSDDQRDEYRDGASGSSDSDMEDHPGGGGAAVEDAVAAEMEMDIDAPRADESDSRDSTTSHPHVSLAKGKQRAVEPPTEAAPRKRHSRPKPRQRERVFTLRPILTIQRSQGFVWNQDLFVPPYIKDRYVASTSPPSSSGFMPSSVSSTNSALTEYESIEVVEIRVQEGEYAGIIPRP
ncbi:unnamed protein product [Mycena citricolor]|uniref:Uncharacterized protein n=1 Tax=Mycena citricolor TaxID=2018698 RepID=A0AAD2JZ46_9AGAR|nr:unnamed protein product [Mycena citricolor]CAK5269967.1 unnamed protein product [Mycena citricolor]